jgi:sulfur-carrier protein adenylyltransferase/sulfurtransferase
MKAFEFTHDRIDAAELAATLAEPSAGGFGTFEGWVRNQNEGRAVSRLEYEAFEELAQAEGERIVADAVERSGALRARCVHRLGALPVGEIAVWVGVAAAHRTEAFAACRRIIDEIKHRLPIWKKEHYADGDSGWVNCENCAKLPAAPGFDYSRQEALPEIGAAGQQRLAQASVTVIGAGGLGCAVLTGLAGAGVGRLFIVDDDVVDPANLHRQPLYGPEDIGRPKAVAAASRLASYNPTILLQSQQVRLNAGNARQLVAQADIVVDCSDNFATKFLVNDAAVLAGRPAVLASVYQYEGQLQVVRADSRGSCLRCQWPEATRDGLVGNCAQSGVLGPVPAVLGNLQAMEVLKILLNLPGQLRDEVLLVDLLDSGQRRLSAPRAPECMAQCARVRPLESTESEQELEITLPLAEATTRGYRIIDIREPEECSFAPLPLCGHDAIPLANLLDNAMALDPDLRYLLVCAHGIRSRAAALHLRAVGRGNVWSLRGGLALQAADSEDESILGEIHQGL